MPRQIVKYEGEKFGNEHLDLLVENLIYRILYWFFSEICDNSP